MISNIDLVADLGEGYGDWTMGDYEALLDILTSANIACGFHAGDPRTIDRTVAACVERGVAIGAHPSFPDRVGFGRRDMGLTAYEVRTDVTYQLGALQAAATFHGARVEHLAPHGRLGNLVAVRPDYAEAVAEAVRGIDPEIAIVTQDGALAEAARAAGLRVGIVGIVDRAYRGDGTLVPRGEAGAVLHDTEQIAARTVRLVRDGVIDTVEGTEISVHADTVLLHGDNPGAVHRAATIRAALEAAGVGISTLGTVLKEEHRARRHA